MDIKRALIEYFLGSILKLKQVVILRIVVTNNQLFNNCFKVGLLVFCYELLLGGVNISGLAEVPTLIIDR